jgi:hypothetical protein
LIGRWNNVVNGLAIMIGLQTFFLEPSSIPVGDVSVSAELGRDRPAERWGVTVVISRAPDQQPIRGSEIGAHLVTEDGTSLPLLDHPTGPLVEAGGSLGMSVNAVFGFRDSGTLPTQLHVTYRGETAVFNVITATDDPR